MISICHAYIYLYLFIFIFVVRFLIFGDRVGLNHEVVKDISTIDPRRVPTLQCFGLVGGVSLPLIG